MFVFSDCLIVCSGYTDNHTKRIYDSMQDLKETAREYSPKLFAHEEHGDCERFRVEEKENKSQATPGPDRDNIDEDYRYEEDEVKFVFKCDNEEEKQKVLKLLNQVTF
eukprot:Awhi_evm1s15451